MWSKRCVLNYKNMRLWCQRTDWPQTPNSSAKCERYVIFTTVFLLYQTFHFFQHFWFLAGLRPLKLVPAMNFLTFFVLLSLKWNVSYLCVLRKDYNLHRVGINLYTLYSIEYICRQCLLDTGRPIHTFSFQILLIQ